MPASKILEAIGQLAKATDHEDWRHPALCEYLMHGDETLLEQVPEFGGTWCWARQMAVVLPRPEQWTEEAARVFRIAKLKNGWLIVKEWLGQTSVADDRGKVGFETAVACVRTAGFSEVEIRYMASKLQTWDGQKPTPFGLLLLEGTDAEALEWLGPPGIIGPIERQWWVIKVLATAQPERLHRLLDRHDLSNVNDYDGCRGYGTMVRANPGAFADRAYRHAETLPQESTGRIGLMITVAEVSPLSYMRKALEEACRVVETAEDRGHPANVFGEGGLIATRFLVRQKHPRAMELCCRWMNSVVTDKGGWRVAGRMEIWEELRTQHPDWQPALIKAAVTSKWAKLVVVGLGWWRECWQAEDASERVEALQALAHEKQPGGTGEPKVVALARITALLWALMQHKSKDVRKGAARALADLGETFVSQKAQELLQHKKAEAREAAADLLSILSAPLGADAESKPSSGAARRAKLLQGRAIENPKSLAYPFLEDMYSDDYFPARMVDKVTKILLRLCEQIELQKPADLDALYKLTHAATEKINLLQDQFEDAGSEIETNAREIMSDNFCFIASIYGFEGADREELIATRDW